MKQKLKKFWTLDRHHAEGFTLVELIVVIAILAILGGIGLPAYSGYVKKANMGADEALMNEIKHAILLAYYADAENFEPGAVVVSTSDTEVQAEGNAFLSDAMEKSFGTSWQELKLKYDGWTSTKAEAVLALNNSSFSDGNGGVKKGLLGTVDKLTGTLSGLFAEGNLTGDYTKFYAYLDENGIDRENVSNSQMVANSVVPYLSTATPKDETVRGNMKTELVKNENWVVDGKIDVVGALAAVGTSADGQSFPALAATYATMKGFCEWADENYPGYNLSAELDLIELDTFWDPEANDGKGDDVPVAGEGHVATALQQALDAPQVKLDGKSYAESMAPLFEQYLASGAAEKDVKAYFGVIDSIADNKDYIMENLDNSTDFYTSRADYLNTYLKVTAESGDVVVVVSMGADGIEVGTVGMGTED